MPYNDTVSGVPFDASEALIPPELAFSGMLIVLARGALGATESIKIVVAGLTIPIFPALSVMVAVTLALP